MNNNICMISYYGLRDSLLCAAKSLEDMGYNVFDFPLFKYIYDIHDKIDNYIFLLKQFIIDNNIEIVLWWFVNISTDEFIDIKKSTGVKYILFNWDEPYNWELCDLKNKSKYFDAVFVTCQETCSRYLENGTRYSHYLLPGFSPKIHNIRQSNKTDSEKYSCDISFCCTNLYSDEKSYPDQYINRKNIVDKIYAAALEKKFVFHIYGPDFLKELYPESYRGYCSYMDSQLVFNNSKINLCTHVVSNKSGYINERVILIGGSGGLLLVDPVKDIDKIFEINNEIIILDRDDTINQIVNILQNYDSYSQVRINFHKKCLEKYSYYEWAKNIHNGLIYLNM